MSEIIIAPSLFAAQSSNFERAIARTESGGAKYLHIDIMDGHFVPNLSFGPNVVAGLRAVSTLYFDLHLMVEYPERFTLSFIQAGADCITVHAEVKGDIEAVLGICRKHKVGFGVALKPQTPPEAIRKYFTECDIILVMGIEPGFGGQKFMPEALKKIAAAKMIRDELGARCKISIDGGVNVNTAYTCVAAGADILVAGSAVFQSDNPAVAIAELTGE